MSMRNFRPGQQVVLRRALKRNRRHKYGRVRLSRGASGRVVRRQQKRFSAPRYDVDFRRSGHRTTRVRRLPAASLSRHHYLRWAIVLAIALLAVGYLTQRF
jgi:hypothetical protein